MSSRPLPRTGLEKRTKKKLLPSDSTIATPLQKKTVIVFNERFMAARHEKEDAKNKAHPQASMFLFAKKGLSNDDVGLAGGTVFEGIRPGAGFKTGDFAKEKLGGGHRRTTLT